MRRARHSVFPEPAPASTRRFTSRRSRMKSRAAWSGTRPGLRHARRASGRDRAAALAGSSTFRAARSAARRPQARPKSQKRQSSSVRRVDEGARREQIEELAQHVADLRLARRGADDALSPAADRGEVVRADDPRAPGPSRAAARPRPGRRARAGAGGRRRTWRPGLRAGRRGPSCSPSPRSCRQADGRCGRSGRAA